MTAIKFGTDGWRALMDREFTFENVERVAQAFADLVRQSPSKNDPARIVIGFDYRKDSERFARTVAEVLVGNGLQVTLSSQACPTPAVSFAIIDGAHDAGIILTASHNPPGYNGMKIKTDYGGSADKSITDAVEGLVGARPVRKGAFVDGNPRIEPLTDRYLPYLSRYVDLEKIRQAPYRVLVDSMHGVGARHIERLLAGGRIQVETIRAERDVTFGGVSPEPIARYLGPSIELMKTGRYDLAVVTDGDADRVGALRPGGDFVSPGVLLSLILLHFAQDLGRKGSVVTTVSNTALIYKVARKFGLTVHETPVGFKYVCEIMRRENVLIGGEESGGIGFQNYLYERDGMLSGLLVLEMMAMRGQSFQEILEQVEREFGRLYYLREDIDYPNELKPKLFESLRTDPPRRLAGQPVREAKTSDGYKFILGDDSWLLFRLSGTEPILRVYAEATSPELARALLDEGKERAFGLARA